MLNTVKRGFTLSMMVVACSTTGKADSSYMLELAVPVIPENTEKLDGTLNGYHGQTVKKVIDTTGISYRVIAPAHAYQAFYDKKFLCITPDSQMYYGENSGFIDSEAFSRVNWVIVQRKGSKKLLSADGLKGLKVGSFYAPDEIAAIVPQEGVLYDVNANLTVNLLKVAFKRVDVAVLPETGLQEMIDGNGNLKNLTIKNSPVLATVPEAIMCHDDDKGRAILKKINQALKTVR